MNGKDFVVPALIINGSFPELSDVISEIRREYRQAETVYAEKSVPLSLWYDIGVRLEPEKPVTYYRVHSCGIVEHLPLHKLL